MASVVKKISIDDMLFSTKDITIVPRISVDQKDEKNMYYVRR